MLILKRQRSKYPVIQHQCVGLYFSFSPLTEMFPAATPSDATCHLKLQQSMAICCPALPGDVTNVLTGGRKELFPSNWKARRSFRHWCYLADVPPSWPSMRDEPLYISLLPLWMEPELHHHSNGCGAGTPRGPVISQIAWEKEIGCDGGSWGFGEVCTCVYVRCDPLFVLVFLPFVRIVDQDSLDIEDEFQLSLTATQLSSIFYFETSWNSVKSLFHNTVVAFDPSWQCSLNNPLLCGLSSFSASVFAPYSSLCPQGQPLLKERSFEQFAPSLPHYFTLAPSVSPRRTALGFHYSTSQSSSRYPLCAITGASSHTARQKGLPHHYLLIKMELYCAKTDF